MTEQNHALRPIDNLVIVGGGTAGWMAAAALSKVFKDRLMKITLVESDAIGTVGVGEATIPEILNFHQILGIDENAFLAYTHGTFKLGIEFVDWYQKGKRYLHPFGKYGKALDSVPFHQHWQKLYLRGEAPDIETYSLAAQACYQNKFARPVEISNSPLQDIAYAFHFDAGRYAQFLRQYAEARGVVRQEGTIHHVSTDNDNGFVKSVTLEDGTELEGDLFIDCSGFNGLLIEKTLHTGYENWSHYLPCDSAVAVQSEKLNPLPPFTRASAREAGWQWRIPLQHRTGNGHVYASGFTQDDTAQNTLLENIEGDIVNDPRTLRFTTGKRRKLWNRNVVALGLAGGFLEPLESTSIHLVYEGIAHLMALFPNKDMAPVLRDRFNRLQEKSYLNVRDFLILHYKATQRDDSAFWRYCRDMDIPDTLQQKIDVFRESGRVFRDNNELFGEVSWLAVMHGQGIRCEGYNPIVDTMPLETLRAQVEEVGSVIANSVKAMPDHEEFIRKYCRVTRPPTAS